MREIKFRCWDGLRCEMNYEDMNFSHNKEECEVMCGGWSMYEEVWTDENVKNNPNLGIKSGDLIFPVMQYTGLKDKNGQEIYDGDILKKPNKVLKGDPYKSNGSTYKVVEWKMSSNFTGWNITEKGSKNYKIIGNIYQSPELIKQT